MRRANIRKTKFDKLLRNWICFVVFLIMSKHKELSSIGIELKVYPSRFCIKNKLWMSETLHSEIKGFDCRYRFKTIGLLISLRTTNTRHT